MPVLGGGVVEGPQPFGGVVPDLFAAAEQVLPKPVVSDRAVIPFDAGVLLGLARLDVVQSDPPPSRNPDLQKWLCLLLLAPDWAESNFRTFTGVVSGVNEAIGKLVRDMQPSSGMDKVYRGF